MKPPYAVATGYLGLAFSSLATSVFFRHTLPWQYPLPWLSFSPLVALLASLAGGVLFAIGTVVLTRTVVTRYHWAQNLHRDLRGAVRHAGTGELLTLAVLSSVGEELFFRGLLLPWLGLALSSLLFGLAHQLPGPSRWVWALWATVVGVVFGVLFLATGSLIGSLLAHGLINGANLLFLRDHNPNPPTSQLGGLLRR